MKQPLMGPGGCVVSYSGWHAEERDDNDDDENDDDENDDDENDDNDDDDNNFRPWSTPPHIRTWKT